MMDVLQTIIVAYDEWIIAENLAVQADHAVKAMAAYALSDHDRMAMYNERRDAASVARGKATEALRTLNVAIETARKGQM